MSPNDPRHGTHAGYLQGCQCEPCRRGHYAESVERGLYRLRHGSCRVSRETVDAFVEPWLKMGLTPYAIAHAVGIADDRLLATGPVNRATWAPLSTFTEDKIDDNAKVYGHLTRTRIYSLMAIGHRLRDMPINSAGQWRTYERCTVGSARAIRDYFREHEAQVGPARNTQARALNAGHLPPMAWDDPDTLAWPDGTPDVLPGVQSRRTASTRQSIDHAVVERVLAGDTDVRTNALERREILRRSRRTRIARWTCTPRTSSWVGLR